MKKYRIHIVFVVLIFAISVTSCKKDWLEAKADLSKSIPTTLEDFQGLLNNENLNSDNWTWLAEIASDGHYTSEAAWSAGTSIDPSNAYIWSEVQPYMTKTMAHWSNAYQKIFVANTILDALKLYKPSDAEQTEYKNIKGQALAHRAINYYSAAQIWVPPYESSTAAVQLGLPLLIEVNLEKPLVRATTAQTYDQILKDLLEAEGLVSEAFVAKTRVNKNVIFAQLARVYLSMRDYQKAGAYADSCLKKYSHLMDYNTLSLTANFIGSPNLNPEVVFHNTYFNYYNAYLSTGCFIDTELYNSYDSNDLRKLIFFKQNSDGSIGYKGSYNDQGWSHFCGLATDELYLIRAESYARLGNTNLSMKDLNDLLRTRWKKVDGLSTYTDQTAANANDALDKILLERKKELLMRGLRWTDLRRLNFEDRFRVTLTRIIGGHEYTLEPGSFRYTFPIPLDVLSGTAMPQNPGW